LLVREAAGKLRALGMMRVRKKCETQIVYAKAFLLWIFLGCVTGVVLGVVGSAFHFSIEKAAQLREAYPWLLFLLPAGGFLIALLYHFFLGDDMGTNFVLIAVRDNRRLRLRKAPLIFVSTVITHLLGGSAGREGAALQLGGSIASCIGHKLRLDCQSLRILVVCGMSAAFSAVFGTPLAAAVFAMEVVHVGVMHYSAIVPALLASLVGFQAASLCGAHPVAFHVTGIPGLTLLSMAQVTVLGILLAVLAILFYEGIHTASRLYQKFLPNIILRAAAGGLLVVALTLLVGARDYNGAGMEMIHSAVGGSARPEAFLLKILFTALTLGAGFKGGEIVPAFFTGATFGCVAGPLLGLSPSFSAALGMTALFCGITNCPITSLLLSFELFGGEGLPLFALCIAVSYMLSGHGGLYSEQQMVFSKLKPELYAKDPKICYEREPCHRVP